MADSMAHLYAGKRNPQAPQNIQADLDIAYPVFEVFSDLVIADEKTTRTSKLALNAVEEALAQAGLNQQELKRMRVGVAIGTTVGSTLNNEPFYRKFKADQKPDLEAIQKYLNNNPALFIEHNRHASHGIFTLQVVDNRQRSFKPPAFFRPPVNHLS